MSLTNSKVHQDSVEHLLRFAKENPWKYEWPEELMRRFLTQLSSSGDLIFDLNESGRRTGLGVLLDKVKNPGNLANLEILGISIGQDPVRIIDKILYLSKEQTPKSYSGFQVAFHHSFEGLSELASKHKLESYYESFEMLRIEKLSDKQEFEDRFRLATSADDPEVYGVLTESFKSNLDTSIPEFSDWKTSRQNSKSKTWLAEQNGKIIGFLTLIPSENENKAEIRNVGVLPNMRGQGIGKSLLENALSFLRSIGISTCTLSVAVQNIKALELYQHLGFEKVDHYFVYASRI